MKSFQIPSPAISLLTQSVARLFFAVFFTVMFLAMPDSAHTEGKQQNSYTQLLAEIASHSPEEKIERLQNFIRDQPEEERAYLKLLECYRDQQKVPTAKAFFQKLQADSSHRRSSSWMLAKIAANDSLREEAATLFAAALQDPRHTSLLLYDLAAFLHENYSPSEVQNFLRHHLPRAEELALALGFYHYFDGNFGKAESSLKQASPATRKDALVLYVLSDCALRNEALSLAKRYEQANDFAFNGRLQARQNGDREWQARFEVRLGDIAYQKDSIEEAQASYERADKLAQEASDLCVEQKARGGAGRIQYLNGSYEDALNSYDAAGVIAERICAYRDASLWYSNKCRLLLELGRFADALEAGLASERLARRAHDEEGLIRIQLKLGHVYCDLSQVEFAKATALEARALADKRGYFKLYQRANALLGDIGARGKKFDMARTFYDQYLSYLEYTNDQFERHSYIAKQADTYKEERKEQYEKAIALYKEASTQAAAAKSDYYQAWYQLEIADLQTKLGRLEEAEQTLKDVLQESLRESEEGFIRYKLSWGQLLQKSGKPAHAIAAYREADTLINEARPRLDLDHLRIGYFSERAQAARGLAECYYLRYQTTQALTDRDSLFHYLEMAKGRSFHDLALENGGKAVIDAKAKANYDSACQELESLQRYLRLQPESFDSLRAQLEAARYSVVYNRPRFIPVQQNSAQRLDGGGKTTAALLNPFAGAPAESASVAEHNVSKDCSFNKAQEFLRQHNAALLLYHISEETAFVFVITDTEARALPLQTTRAQLAALRDTLMSPFNVEELNAGSVTQLKFQARLAHRFYELLIKPAAEAMNLPPQLIVVPEPAFSNLPFEMFLSEAPAKAVYTPRDSATYAKDFLLHRYAFVYSPTFCMVKKNLSVPSPSRGVLVLANPDLRLPVPAKASHYRGRRWGAWEPLPYAEIEAASIEKLSSHTITYTREKATESAFSEAARYRVVHLASHAFVDAAYYDFSGLVLALDSASTSDGLLMGYEIAKQKLRCDLVTLSACQTGKGELVEGEGALGLPRLFLRAGAKSVIMTLWQVDDRFASKLLPEFYEEYLNNGLAKVNALTAAKRAMLRNQEKANGVYQQHPFYWAAFTLYGDPGQQETSWLTTSRVLIAGVASLILFALFFYFRLRLNQARSNE